MPSRLLHGLLPSAILESHFFWQDQHDNLRGYLRDENATEQTIIYVTLEKVNGVEGYNTDGICAIITRTREGRRETLASLLNASPHSPLGSIAAAFSKIEHLSHVLVWTSGEGENMTIVSVELPRLSLTFRERKIGPAHVLFSVDHANLFIPNFAYGTGQVREPENCSVRCLFLNNDNNKKSISYIFMLIIIFFSHL